MSPFSGQRGRCQRRPSRRRPRRLVAPLRTLPGKGICTAPFPLPPLHLPRPGAEMGGKLAGWTLPWRKAGRRERRTRASRQPAPPAQSPKKGKVRAAPAAGARNTRGAARPARPPSSSPPPPAPAPGDLPRSRPRREGNSARCAFPAPCAPGRSSLLTPSPPAWRRPPGQGSGSRAAGKHGGVCVGSARLTSPVS